MTLELFENAGGDPRNAQYLALASDFAYLPPADGVKAFRDDLGLDAQLYSVGNTQVYVGSNDQHIVAAFRGTEAPTSLEGIKDWLLTDAATFLILPEGRIGTDFAAAGVGARFHRGFMTALEDIWAPFLQCVEAELNKKERPLWVAGHSLGGALALLATWRLQRQFLAAHQIYTFGGPMVGNAAATKAFDREFAGKIFRYVNTDDLVPKLPTVSLLANTYGHCEKEIGVGAVAQATAGFLSQLAARAVDGVLNASLMDTIWDFLKQTMGAHDIAKYRALVGSIKENPSV